MTDEQAAAALGRILGPGWIVEPVGQDQAPPIKTELTAAGEQYVIPGCERQTTAKARQIGLWD